jgi:hypothetical protein
MYVDWTKHLKDPEDKSRFENSIYGAKDVLDRLKDILSDMENALDRNELSIEVYSSPNWAERQAHKNGNRETLNYLKKLVNLDEQRRPK